MSFTERQREILLRDFETKKITDETTMKTPSCYRNSSAKVQLLLLYANKEYLEYRSRIFDQPLKEEHKKASFVKKLINHSKISK